MTPLDFKKPLANDKGLVCGITVGGSCSFDIFDAEHWNGSNEDGRNIASELTRRWNAFEPMREALRDCITDLGASRFSAGGTHGSNAKSMRLQEITNKVTATLHSLSEG